VKSCSVPFVRFRALPSGYYTPPSNRREEQLENNSSQQRAGFVAVAGKPSAENERWG
jgi:hypothetical protein